MHFKSYERGEYVSDVFIQMWAEWESQFFDLETALVINSVKAGNAKLDHVARKKTMKKVPFLVKVVRSGALAQMKGLDKMLFNTTRQGLVQYELQENEK